MYEYESIEEYWEAHQNDTNNFGKEEIPYIYQKDKGSLRVRRGVHIHAYVGGNGGGKSLAMVNDTIATLNGIKWNCDNRSHFHYRAHGQTSGYRKVLSTVRLIDPRTGKDHPLWIPYDDHRRLLSVEHADILMDEITGVASAYEAMAMPTQVNNVLMQLRRRDCFLRWTTPNWAAAAKRIREVTKAVTYCKGSFPVIEKGRTWPSNMFFLWKTYDALGFESFTVGVRERLVPITFQWFSRMSKKNFAPHVYNTLEEVLSISASNEHGLCVHCGQKRTIGRCTCDRALDTEENLTAIAAVFGSNEFFEREAKGSASERGDLAVLEEPHLHEYVDDVDAYTSEAIEKLY